MARPLRLDFAGAWHHVMNRGADHRTLFEPPEIKGAFLRLLDETSKVYRVQVHGYCLMDNHYHLLLHTPQAGLSRAMRHLNGVFTQRFHRIRDPTGPCSVVGFTPFSYARSPTFTESAGTFT